MSCLYLVNSRVVVYVVKLLFGTTLNCRLQSQLEEQNEFYSWNLINKDFVTTLYTIQYRSSKYADISFWFLQDLANNVGVSKLGPGSKLGLPTLIQWGTSHRLWYMFYIWYLYHSWYPFRPSGTRYGTSTKHGQVEAYMVPLQQYCKFLTIGDGDWRRTVWYPLRVYMVPLGFNGVPCMLPL